MEPYRVLLVDDEEDIRVGIGRKMDWAGLGFALVGEAENGQEALELAEQLKPDVVLTDIKMPFMDGLELCQVLTQRLPATKFIIFSGFDDFEYAKQAIRMNVSEYILKPINAVELSNVLQTLKQQLDSQRAERQDMETLRQRYRESLPVLRELFFTHLLDGRVRPEQIAERAARYEIDLQGSAWIAALMHFEEGEEGRELLAFSVERLFQENFHLDGCHPRSFFYNDSIALLASFSGELQIYAFTEELNRVCKLAKSYLGISLTVGVGEPCVSPGELHNSAIGAKNALDYRVLMGAGKAIYIGDLEPDHGRPSLAFDENDEQTLTALVKLGVEQDLQAWTQNLVERICQAGLALSQCHLFFLELLNCLLKLTRSANLELEDVFGTGFAGVIQITDFDSPQELGAWCLGCCRRMQKLIGQQRSDTTWRTTEKAKAFIGEHYMESDLSVERLCEQLHVSPAYFSTLFKREIKMSFTAYVTMVRMEQAAALLKTTEDKTYLIAEQVGYQDPNYFSYVFKKYFGVSPTKFRTQ